MQYSATSSTETDLHLEYDSQRMLIRHRVLECSVLTVTMLHVQSVNMRWQCTQFNKLAFRLASECTKHDSTSLEIVLPLVSVCKLRRLHQRASSVRAFCGWIASENQIHRPWLWLVWLEIMRYVVTLVPLYCDCLFKQLKRSNGSSLWFGTTSWNVFERVQQINPTSGLLRGVRVNLGPTRRQFDVNNQDWRLFGVITEVAKCCVKIYIKIMSKTEHAERTTPRTLWERILWCQVSVWCGISNKISNRRMGMLSHGAREEPITKLPIGRFGPHSIIELWAICLFCHSIAQQDKILQVYWVANLRCEHKNTNSWDPWDPWAWVHWGSASIRGNGGGALLSCQVVMCCQWARHLCATLIHEEAIRIQSLVRTDPRLCEHAHFVALKEEIGKFMETAGKRFHYDSGQWQFAQLWWHTTLVLSIETFTNSQVFQSINFILSISIQLTFPNIRSHHVESVLGPLDLYLVNHLWWWS